MGRRGGQLLDLAPALTGPAPHQVLPENLVRCRWE